MFFKNKIDIGNLTLNFKKDNNYFGTLYNITNHIICNKKVFHLFPIMKDNNKYFFDFNKINKDFKTFLNNNLLNLEIFTGVDENNLYHIYFDTKNEPSIEIIEYFLKIYKKKMTWFIIPINNNFLLRSKVYIYDKNKVITLIENEKNPEEIKIIKENKHQIGYFLPYKCVYSGKFIDAYAKDLFKEKYLCSCYKKALENKLLLFDNYFKNDINKRKDLLLKFLGLPLYYEEKIINYDFKESFLECLEIFKFKDKLCPICNNVKPVTIKANNPNKTFIRTYRKEIERRLNILGLINTNSIFGKIFIMDSLYESGVKEKLIISNKELLNELKKRNLDINIKEELEKLSELPEDEKIYIIYSFYYDKENNNLDKIINKYNLNEKFIKTIQNIYYDRYFLILKNIDISLHEYDKYALSSDLLFEPILGINIFLIKNDDTFLHIELYSDVFFVTNYYNKKEIKYEKKSSINLFASVMEILSGNTLLKSGDNTSYERFVVSNGKKQTISKKDGVRGNFSSIGVNHAVIKIRATLNVSNDNDLIKLLDFYLM